ncbi:MAG: T9SS type A sorting domain-containing protein [Bacteroidales bacterium]|nr:T9SS type A sorting domain-containing protein [Bacteroidales bacterium]
MQLSWSNCFKSTIQNNKLRLFSIDVHNLRKGTYFVKIIHDNTISSHRFLKI